MIEIIPNWHPVFVHFTVALLCTAVLLYLLAYVLKTHPWHQQWLTVARWNLWIGCVFTIATGIAGWLAYNSVTHDTPSHAAMTDHRNWAIATIIVVIQLAVWSLSLYRTGKNPGLAFTIVALLGLGLLMSTAWRGGELVYRYGLGVMSLPKAEGDGHSHNHGDAHDHGNTGGAGVTHERELENHDVDMSDMDFSGMDDFADDSSKEHDHHDHQH